MEKETRRSKKAYTGLPVVRVTQKKKALNWVASETHKGWNV